MAAREARTTDDQVATDDGQAASTPDGNQDELAPNQVRFRDGRVLTIRETSGQHDLMTDRFLTRVGFSFANLSPAMYGQLRAICAIEAIDGKRAYFPKTKEHVMELLDIPTADLTTLTLAYARVNGLDAAGDEDGDFRG